MWVHLIVICLIRCVVDSFALLTLFLILLHRVLILPDGIVKEGKKWISSPMDIAKEISKSLAANALISQVGLIYRNGLYGWRIFCLFLFFFLGKIH